LEAKLVEPLIWTIKAIMEYEYGCQSISGMVIGRENRSTRLKKKKKAAQFKWLLGGKVDSDDVSASLFSSKLKVQISACS
jgi:hypothetical protein